MGYRTRRDFAAGYLCIKQWYGRITFNIKKDLDQDKFLTTEKGKPIERLGRKATGLRANAYDSGVASLETTTRSFEVSR